MSTIIIILAYAAWFYFGYTWANRRIVKEKKAESEAVTLAKHWVVADLTQDAHTRDQVEAQLRELGYRVTRRGVDVVVSKL